MGLNSYVFAIGPFSKPIADCLDYDESFYDDVEGGVLVTSSFFHCETSDSSRNLAFALGLDKVWDFNKFHIDDFRSFRMYNIQCLIEDGVIGEKEWDEFKRLMIAGFTCIFVPNG